MSLRPATAKSVPDGTAKVVVSNEATTAKMNPDEHAGQSDDAGASNEPAQNKPTPSKGNLHPDTDGDSQNSDEDENEGEAPMPTSHLSLRIKRDDDEAALKALMPYLASGFTPIDTGSRPLRYCNHEIHALQISFDAARKEIYPDDLVRSEPTELKEWEEWFDNRNLFERHIHTYLDSEWNMTPKDPGFKEKIKSLTTKDPKIVLKFAQMVALLNIANEKYRENFQLGMIYSGFRGRYDAITEQVDDNHVTQSYLIVDWDRKKNKRDKPIVWIYNTNLDAESEAHSENNETPKYSRNQFMGMAPSSKSGSGHQARIDRVEKFCVGKRLENDIAKKVWILTLRHDRVATDIQCLLGTSLRLYANPIVAIQDHLHLCSPNGNNGSIRKKYIRQVTQNLNNLSAETDKKWAVIDSQIPKEDEQEIDTWENKQCAFYRVIPPTWRDGTPRRREKPQNMDPVFSDINKFKLTDYEIVLGTDIPKPSRRLINENLAIPVMKSNGEKGWARHRRLQLLEYPFGLPDMLPIKSPYTLFANDALRGDVEPAYRAIHGKVKGKTIEMINQLNDEEPRKRYSLSVYRIKKDLKAKHVSADVDFLKGEYVLIEIYRKGKRCTVRDFEGRKAEILLKDMTLFAPQAWNLTLSNEETNLSGLLCPDPGVVAKAKAEETKKAYREAEAKKAARKAARAAEAAAAATEEEEEQTQGKTMPAPKPTTGKRKPTLDGSASEAEHRKKPRVKK